MKKDFVLASSILAGTAIGAGIFSLPYVFRELGLVLGFLYLLFFAGVYFWVHLMYGELAEKSRKEHQFAYLAENYLSPKTAAAGIFLILGGLIFTLTTYLALAPVFAEIVFGDVGFLALLGFWFISSLFMFVNVSEQGWLELLGVLAVLGIVIAVFFAGLGTAVKTPLWKKINLAEGLLPFGPLLFSLAARPAVSQVVALHKRAAAEKKFFSFRKAIFAGSIAPVFVYGVFVLGVLRLNPGVSKEALNSLAVSPILLYALGVMGLIVLWTSYFIIGKNIRDILRIDFKRGSFFSWSVPIAGPLIVYFLGFKDFFAVAAFTGGVFLALEGILVTMMWRRAFKSHRLKPFTVALYAVFVTALVYQIADLLSL